MEGQVNDFPVEGLGSVRSLRRGILPEVLVVVDPLALSSGPWRAVRSHLRTFQKGKSWDLDEPVSNQSPPKRLRKFFVDTTLSFAASQAEQLPDYYAIQFDANLICEHIIAFLVHPNLRDWLLEVVERVPGGREALPLIVFNERFVRFQLPTRIELPSADTVAAADIATQVENLAKSYLASSHDVQGALVGLFQAALQVSQAQARELAKGARMFGNNMPLEVAWYFRHQNDHITSDTDRQLGLARLRQWVRTHPPK